MSQRFWKVFGLCMWLMVAGGLAATFALSSHYAYTRPTTPDRVAGRTHPYNHYHGKLVYLTEAELINTYLAEGSILVGLIGFFIAANKDQLFNSKSSYEKVRESYKEKDS